MICYKIYLLQLGYYGDTINVYHSCDRMEYYGEYNNVINHHSAHRLRYDGTYTSTNDDIMSKKGINNKVIIKQYMGHITGPCIQQNQQPIPNICQVE